MKVALYARVSTRDEGQNPEAQLEPLRGYCPYPGPLITGLRFAVVTPDVRYFDAL
jgi:hypothetical protein